MDQSKTHFISSLRRKFLNAQIAAQQKVILAGQMTSAHLRHPNQEMFGLELVTQQTDRWQWNEK